jgi:hypothetical protein
MHLILMYTQLMECRCIYQASEYKTPRVVKALVRAGHVDINIRNGKE